MPIFHAYDGTELAYRLLGQGAPLICLPGGPMRAGAYLGDLGGLSARRRLVVPDLRGTGDSAVPDDPSTYRCDRLVDDVEALREHLGEERVDLLAHSASANLAALYAARYPERLRTLTLVTPGTRAVGIDVTDQDWREASELRRDEPWYARARAALDGFLAGRAGDRARAAVAPFAYGRWDDAARTHAEAGPGQTNSEAGKVYYQDGVFDPAATNAALVAVTAPVLVLAGSTTRDRPRTAPPNWSRSSPTPNSWCSAAPRTSPGWTTRAPSSVRWRPSSTRTCAVCRQAAPGSPTGCGGSIGTARRARPRPLRRQPDLDPDRRAPRRRAPGVRLRLPRPRAQRLARTLLLELFRDDLHAFLEARNLWGATVIGHSMGAAAAYLLAEREPGLIGRLVLEEVPPPFALDPPRDPAPRPDEELDFDWPVVPSTDAQLNEPDPGWRELLGAITAPTLVIGGGPTSQIAQESLVWLAGRIPDGRYVTIDAGHLVHTERPDEFLAEVRAFGLS